MSMDAGDCYEIVRDAVLSAAVTETTEDDVLWHYVGVPDQLEPNARDRAFMLEPAGPVVEELDRQGCNEKIVSLDLLVAYTTGNPECRQLALRDSHAITDALTSLWSSGSPIAGGHAGPITEIHVEGIAPDYLEAWLLMRWSIRATYMES